MHSLINVQLLWSALITTENISTAREGRGKTSVGTQENGKLGRCPSAAVEARDERALGAQVGGSGEVGPWRSH